MRLTRMESPQQAELLASTHAVVLSASVPQGGTPNEDGRVIVPCGSVFPQNDEHAVGILLADADVTDGACIVPMVAHGFIYMDRMPAAPTTQAREALTGIVFVTHQRQVAPQEE